MSGGYRFMEGFYSVFMRRTSVYVTFLIAGTFLAERGVDYGIHKLWESNNVGIIITYLGGGTETIRRHFSVGTEAS